MPGQYENLALRIDPALKRRIEQHAREMGMSINATCSALLVAALDAAANQDEAVAR